MQSNLGGPSSLETLTSLPSVAFGWPWLPLEVVDLLPNIRTGDTGWILFISVAALVVVWEAVVVVRLMIHLIISRAAILRRMKASSHP